MKKEILISVVSLMASNAWAQVPQELLDLLPTGQNSARLDGTTEDSKKCVVNLSGSAGSFSLEIAVVKSGSQVDHRRMGKLQVGFGHNIQEVKIEDDVLTVSTFHKAEESYSSDSRSTVKALRGAGTLKAVQLIVEEKGFFGYKTTLKEVCNFQNQ